MAGVTPEAQAPVVIEAPAGPDTLDACWRSWIDAGRPACPRRDDGGMLEELRVAYVVERGADFVGPAGRH